MTVERRWQRGLIRLTRDEFVLRREGVTIQQNPFFTSQEGMDSKQPKELVHEILDSYVSFFGHDSLEMARIFANILPVREKEYYRTRLVKFPDPRNPNSVVTFQTITAEPADLVDISQEQFMKIQVYKLLHSSRKNLITISGFHAAFPRQTP